MTLEQEDALFEFIDGREEPFTIKDVTQYVRSKDGRRFSQLSTQIASLIDSRRLAFKQATNTWISRRGVFTGARFPIRPTRLELLNGILIPGHRCTPFANPLVLCKNYIFIWRGKRLEMSASEGSPEEFYPYFTLLGEEYAPQYLLHDNPENEQLYEADPYDEPEEVSLSTLDMRHVYRECGFSPGDRFVATVVDWATCTFELERVPRGAWKQEDLDKWLVWAEKSFFEAFEHVGACACTEEQIAFAYYRGGQVMKSVPAYSAEEFLLEKTCKIELVPFGMESRFWYAGKEIPDYPKLIGIQTQSDQTPVERILYENDVPISEFVLQSYVRNALHMGEFNITKIIDTIAPPAGTLKRVNVEYLATYLLECLDDFRKTYTPLAEKIIGPARQRACELHTAVIELAYSLHKGHIDRSWLPRHVFILLSQIQTHTACLLEELNVDNEKEVAELHAIDSTLDNMIETYEDLKDSLKKAMDNFRHSNLSLVKTGASVQSPAWRTIQISIGGASVWRRIVLPADTTLVRLRSVISAVFDWSGEQAGRFIAQGARSQRILDMEKNIRMNETLSSLNYEGVNEFVYEYNVYWTIAIINLSNYEPGNGEQPRCVAGEGVAPPEVVEGPLRLRRYQNALENGIIAERQQAEKALGEGYADALFNIEHCNQKLRGIYA